MLVKYDPGTIKHEISNNSSIYRKGHLSFLVEARSWKADVGLWLAFSSWNYNRTHFSFPLKLRVALQQEMRWDLHSWLGFRSHAACQAGQILGQDLEAAAIKGTLKGKGWIGRLIQAWGSSCPKVWQQLSILLHLQVIPESWMPCGWVLHIRTRRSCQDCGG